MLFLGLIFFLPGSSLPFFLFLAIFFRGWGSFLYTNSELSFLFFLLVSFSFFITIFVSKNLFFFVLLTCVFSLGFFLTDTQILLYIFFEAAIFPVVIMLLFMGNTFERFEASYFLISFSAFSSYPAFISIFLESEAPLSSNYFLSPLWAVFFSFAFLVKLPLYFFHYWLPKAHVEAPTVGSMILAGLLLKLGGWGILRMQNFFIKSWSFYCVIIFLSLGAVLAPFWALTHSDTKGLVAFSSISHMNFSCLILFLSSFISKTGSVFVFFTHDVISSIMFWTAGLFYHASYSRQIIFISSLKQSSLFFWGLISIFFLANFSTPPFISFFHEFLFFSVCFSFFCNFSFIIAFYFLLVSYFTLFLVLNFSIFKTHQSGLCLTPSKSLMLFSSLFFLLTLFLTQIL